MIGRLRPAALLMACMIIGPLGGAGPERVEAQPAPARPGSSQPSVAPAAQPAAPEKPARPGSATPGVEFWEQVKADDLGAIRFELGRGVDPNVVHPEFGPAIVHAARAKAFEVTRQLARMRTIRIDAEGQGGETALMLAALHGDLPTFRLLIERGAQVNRPGWSPLHYAATGGQLGIIRQLIDRHAFIDAESPNGTTPLRMAARMKQPQAVRLLVELGADPTMRNQAGLDASAYLERAGLSEDAAWLREQALQYLLRYGTLEQARKARAAAAGAQGGTAAPGAPTAPFSAVPLEREVLQPGANPPARPVAPQR
jgi:hypothetical protein